MKISNSTTRIIGTILLVIIAVYGIWQFFGRKSSDEKAVKYIGYVGRYINPQKPGAPPNNFDLMHESSLKEYVSRMSSPYHRFELKTFDSKSDSATIASIYNSIAKDSNIVAVIDNTWGEHFKNAAPIIKSSSIPVVSINADHNSLDFGKNVLFTGNNDNVPEDITAYLSSITKASRVHFITEYDYPVHTLFEESFRKHNITVSHTFKVKGRGFTPKDSLEIWTEIKEYIHQHPESLNEFWIVNVHSTIGNLLIPFMDTHYNAIKIMGHAYIINQSYLNNFGKNNKNTLILISNPSDAISRNLHLDIESLNTTTPDKFKRPPNHSMFVKRCYDAVELLKFKFIFRPDTSSITKADFTRYFHSLQGNTISNDNQIFDIDSTMTVLPELFFAEYTAGKLHSMPLQLNKSRQIIPNLFFGMEIIDIYNININENSFTSDFYYWVKLDSSLKSSEQYIIFQNMKSNQSTKELIFEKLDGRTVYKLYKVSGIFYVNYDLTRYPFDEQEIYISAEILNPSSRIKISFDQRSFELDKDKIEHFKITEWQKKKFFVSVDTHVGYSMHGDPNVNETKNEFKSINFRLFVKRKILSPLLEIVLPLILFGILSIALLFIKDITFENMGEVSVGVFMAIVAFSISFSASTPHSDNLTKADLLFWLTFTVVFLNFLIVIVINAIYEPDVVKNMNIRKINIYFGIVYFLTVAYILLM
ncbi:MAG: hypothetical protein IPM69_16435 [Ignavibacteria bacterium]|nr:hypothetical protein [Ignavibacteria bacterium]